MAAWRSLVVNLAMALGLSGFAMSSAYANSENWDHRPVTSIRYFTNARFQLQFLVNVRGFYLVNHFCILVSSDDDGAEVYWPTEDKLIYWEPLVDPWHPALPWSRDYVDIEHETVATPKDITSKYVVLPWARTEIRSLIEDCNRYGTKFTIFKSYGGWRPISHYPRFRSIRTQLQTLVDEKSDEKRNEFCVIAQQDHDYIVAYVYWLTAHRLIMWSPDREDYDESDGLTDSYSDVDLRTGALTKDRYVPQWDFDYMSKAFATIITNTCKRMGQKFLVIKSSS